MNDWHRKTMELIAHYKGATDDALREGILDIMSDDLAYIEAMIKHIIDLERWIEDVKPILKKG